MTTNNSSYVYIAYDVDSLGNNAFVMSHSHLSAGLGSVACSSSPSRLLEFLLSPPTYSVPSSRIVRAVWSLDSSFGPLLASLGLQASQVVSLGPNKQRMTFPDCPDAYITYYIPGKLFSIKRYLTRGWGPEATYYGVDQFFEGVDFDPSSTIQSRLDMLVSGLAELDVYPSKFTSPISVYEEYLKSHPLDLPTAADIPEASIGVLDAALACDHLWVSNYQVGHYQKGETFDYDINGAFPSAAFGLMDFRDAEIIHSRTVPDFADCGFLSGMVTISPSHPLSFYSPVTMITKAGDLIHPTGTFPASMSLATARLLGHYGFGHLNTFDGWFIRCTRRNYPLALTMSGLYSQRGRSQIANRFAKKSANGLIGKMLEVQKRVVEGVEVERYGDLYNPVWHALITDAVSSSMFTFLAEGKVLPEELVCVTIDGCRTTRQLHIPRDEGLLGDWRYSGSDPCFVLSPGLVLSGSKRSLGDLDYATLTSEIESHPGRTRYEVESGDNLDLNTLDLLQDRYYQSLPKTGRKLLYGKYHSVPVEVRR